MRVKRFAYPALAVAILAISLAASASPASAIVAGHDATQDYPGMGSLQELQPDGTFEQACGATLISPLYAVTGAHCVTNFPDASAKDPSHFRVRFGSADRTTGGTLVSVATVIPHPDWSWFANGVSAPASDLAMIRLSAPVVVIPFLVARPRGSTVGVIGWGKTTPNASGPYPTILQEDSTFILPNSACAPAGITTGDLCIDSHGGHGICLGDSGGPAVQQLSSHIWRALGIVSRGAGNACGDAVIVLTDLVYYRQWIFHVVLTGHA